MAKAKVVAPTREELVSTAKEISAILGLDTPIKITKKMTDEDVIGAIKAAADGNVYETDFDDRSDEEGEEEGVSFFSALADEVMQKIKVDVVPGAPPVAGEEEGEEVIEDEEEGEEVIEDEEEGEEVELPEPIKTKSVKESKQKAAVKLPASSKTAKVDAVKGKTATKEKESPKSNYTRSHALVDAIEAGPGTKEDVIIRSDDLFIENNPKAKSGKSTATSMMGYVLPTLVILNYVTYENGIITPVK